MYECDEANLIIVRQGQNENGFPVETYDKIPVFCHAKSVRYTEYYQALKTNIEPRLVVELRAEDWELSRHRTGGCTEYASRIEYDDEVFEIVRWYQTSKAMIELTLTSLKHMRR